MNRLHTTAEAAEILNVSPSWLKRGAASRSIPHTRVGRYVRFTDADLERIARPVDPTVTALRRRRTA